MSSLFRGTPGAGIYVLVGKVAGEAGYYAPLAFFVASIIAALSAGVAAYIHQKILGTVYLFEILGTVYLFNIV